MANTPDSTFCGSRSAHGLMRRTVLGGLVADILPARRNITLVQFFFLAPCCSIVERRQVNISSGMFCNSKLYKVIERTQTARPFRVFVFVRSFVRCARKKKQLNVTKQFVDPHPLGDQSIHFLILFLRGEIFVSTQSSMYM